MHQLLPFLSSHPDFLSWSPVMWNCNQKKTFISQVALVMVCHHSCSNPNTVLVHTLFFFFSLLLKFPTVCQTVGMLMFPHPPRILLGNFGKNLRKPYSSPDILCFCIFGKGNFIIESVTYLFKCECCVQSVLTLMGFKDVPQVTRLVSVKPSYWPPSVYNSLKVW